MPNNPSGRITRVEAPVASPGCCGICGISKHDNGFADANLHFEFYGTFILCETCVRDYADLFGYLSLEQSNALRELVQHQAEELVVFRKAILGLESAVDALTNVRALASVSVTTGFLESLVSPVPAESEQVDEGVTEFINTGEGEQLTIDEPAPEQRPDDVRNTASASIDELISNL